MLRVFFLLVAYLTDYRAAADALHSGLTLGLANAALLCLGGAWLAIRGWRVGRSHQEPEVVAHRPVPKTQG